MTLGEAGEIVAKCEGFWNNPEATAERIVDGHRLPRRQRLLRRLQLLSGRAGERDRRRPDVVELEVFGIPDERCEGRSISRGARTGRALLRSPRHDERSGKIKRMELREPFWVDRERARTLARTSQEVRAIHLLRRVL